MRSVGSAITTLRQRTRRALGFRTRTGTECASAIIEIGSYDADDMHREAFECCKKASTRVSPKLDHGVASRGDVVKSSTALRQGTDKVDVVAL